MSSNTTRPDSEPILTDLQKYLQSYTKVESTKASSPPPPSTEKATPSPELIGDSCPLLTIPTELHLEIYSLAFVYSSYDCNKPEEPPLLSTCKQIRVEAMQIYRLQLAKDLRPLKRNMDSLKQQWKECALRKESASMDYEAGMAFFVVTTLAAKEADWEKAMKPVEEKIVRLRGEGLTC